MGNVAIITGISSIISNTFGLWTSHKERERASNLEMLLIRQEHEKKLQEQAFKNKRKNIILSSLLATIIISLSKSLFF